MTLDRSVLSGKSELSISVCVLALATTLTTPIHAQDAAAASGASDAREIIVTAQRRAERLEDVPVSITALSESDLERANVVSFRDIETISVGTRISSTGIFVQPAIRGITATAVGPGIENNIAFYVDGFYQPSNTALGSDLANVTSVEILKGPQGTLYGRNALGGAILVSTREPNDDEDLILDGDMSYGSRDDVRLRVYMGGRIAEGVSFGVGAYHRENDGYIKLVEGADTIPASDLDLTAFGGPFFADYITPSDAKKNVGAYENTEVRAKLKLEPTSDLSITLGYNFLYKFNPGPLAYNNEAYTYFSGLPVPPAGTPAHAIGRDEYSGNVPIDYHVRQNEGTLKVSLETSAGTLNSYTNYQTVKPVFDQDFDGTLVNFLRVRSSFSSKTFAESLDFTSQPISGLTLIVGGLYFDDDSRSLGTDIWSLGNYIFTPGTKLKTKAYAVYGDVTWEAMDRLFINAGLRYSHESKSLSADRLGDLSPAKVSFGDVTAKASVRYEFAERSNVYASFSQGFKSGTLNSIGQTIEALTTPVEPETVDAFEIGVKTANSLLRLEAAAYYYDYTNLQVSSIVTDPATGRVGTLLTNAAKAENYGGEISVTLTPTEALNVRAGIAYTHARYKEFTDSSTLIVCTPPGGVPRNQETYIVGCPFTGAEPAVGDALVQDLSGRRIARAPDWTASLSGDYTLPIGEGDLVIAGNVSYSSQYDPTREIIDPVTQGMRYSQEGYFIGSASLTYNLPGDHLWIRGFVDNIGNKRFKIVSTGATRGDYAIYNEPRRFGVTIGYRH